LYRQAWRHALAICCIAAPLLLAAAVPDQVLHWLIPETTKNLSIPRFTLLPDEKLSRNQQPGAASVPADQADAAPSPPRQNRGRNDIDKIELQDRKTLLAARNISGRYRYAVTSALLFLVSIAAFAFGAVVLAERRGRAALAAAVVGSGLLSCLLALFPPAFERVRPLIVEFILRDADGYQFLKPLTFDRWETSEIVEGLIRFNTGIGVLGVGMLLCALYEVSIRAFKEDLTPNKLAQRREIARWVLGLGSAILVVAVLQSAVLVEWPPSLLVESQQLALKPIGSAMTLLLGAMGTIALLAALAPAIAAFMLDVRAYRATPEGRASERPEADELGFAPLSSITGVLAALAPLLFSGLAEVIKAVL
jgi:hypothetical protein